MLCGHCDGGAAVDFTRCAPWNPASMRRWNRNSLHRTNRCAARTGAQIAYYAATTKSWQEVVEAQVFGRNLILKLQIFK